MTGYSFNSYLKGQQYYFGTTLGAAYKVLPNLSVFGGVRMLYGSAKYNGYVKDIMVAGPATGGNEMAASQLFGQMKTLAAAAGLTEKAAELAKYELVTQGINLNCKQKAFGVAPIIGVDYKIGKLNLAAKYDFKVRMRLKNDNPDPNFNVIAAAVPQLAKFADGQEVAEDSPALLTIGAQYEITPKWRVMAGYHHFFDVDTKQYTDDLIDDTDEVNIGTEYDVTDWLQVSAGLQKTMYDMEDDFMNDISFNVPSYTFGFGVGVKVAKNVRVNAAYFQTNYKTRDVTSNEGMVKNSYTRTNRVFGLGCDIDF
jgi:long-chain fatty acid transport protein